MKPDRIETFKKIQRLQYRRKYGNWYRENIVYFLQFLSSQQGELTVYEYYDKFSWL